MATAAEVAKGLCLRIIRYYPRAWKGDGGIRNSVCHIAAASARSGADLSVAIEDDAVPPPGDSFRWIPLRHSGPHRFRRPCGLEAHLQGADLLVLHSGWVYHNAFAASVATRMGVPYVLEPRGAYHPSFFNRRRLLKSLWWTMFERKLVQAATAVHVFFEDERESLRSIGYDGPTIAAFNGVSVPEQARWDGGSGGYLLWIGRFDPQCKGLDLLLQAMKLLPPSQRPPLRMHGSDWNGGKGRVVELVEALELGADVHIGDAVHGDRKWQLIRRAAAFAYPSRWEAFGNSAAEAVAAGVPTLVTPYPLGNWLYSRGAATQARATPEALAEGVRAVLSPAAAERAARGQRLLEAELSWDAVARSWLRQAEEVVAARSAPSRSER